MQGLKEGKEGRKEGRKGGKEGGRMTDAPNHVHVGVDG
jgi:hypothetical protein